MLKIYNNDDFVICHKTVFSDNISTDKVFDIVDLYPEASEPTKENLKQTMNQLISMAEKLRKEFHDFNGLYISSSYRKNDRNRPHREGRALDISRILLNNVWYYLIDTNEFVQWFYFWDLCVDKYNDGTYSQIISPYGCLDKWSDDNRVIELIKSHQDHFHIGLTP